MIRFKALNINKVFITSYAFAYANRKPFARALYVQGQSHKPNTREYFYYIDHQGMRLQLNETGRYEKEFPYFSPCGRESNYVRCDDVPFVYTHVVPDPGEEKQFRFCYGHAGDDLFVKFEPDKVIMLPKTGRVYHPAPKKVGGIGLVKSSLAIEFSKNFTFGNSEEDPPTHFTWNGKTYEIVKWHDSLFSNVQSEGSGG